MKKLKKIYRFIKMTLQVWFVMIALTVAGVYAAGKMGIISPIYPYVVMSGSMEPEINAGGVVLVQAKPFGYVLGDIITFGHGVGKNMTTHRVVELVDDGGVIAYKTKGDANDNVDFTTISRGEVVGSVIWHIPYLGFGVDFAKRPYGFILLVIVPATIIVYEELKTILNELKKALKKLLGKKENKSTEKSVSTTAVSPTPLIAKLAQAEPPETIVKEFPYEEAVDTGDMRSQAPLPPSTHASMWMFQSKVQKQEAEPKVQVVKEEKTEKKESGGWKMPRVFGIVPAIGAVAIFLGVSGSFFLDMELSPGNILGAAATYADPNPTPTPGVAETLVINEVLPDSSCTVGGSPKETEWLEIYNGYSYSVDLKDFSITDGTNTIALIHSGSLTLDPGELAMLAHDNSIFVHCSTLPSGTIKGNLGTGTFNINTGILQLLDDNEPTPNIIDTVIWGSAPLNPVQDESIERLPEGWDSAFGALFNADDFYIPIGGPTPGY